MIYAFDLQWSAPAEAGKPRPVCVPIPDGASPKDWIALHWGDAWAYTLATAPPPPPATLRDGYFKVCGINPAVLPVAIYEVVYGECETDVDATELAQAMSAAGMCAQIYKCGYVYLEQVAGWFGPKRPKAEAEGDRA